jgi:hypothetical protein
VPHDGLVLIELGEPAVTEGADVPVDRGPRRPRIDERILPQEHELVERDVEPRKVSHRGHDADGRVQGVGR